MRRALRLLAFCAALFAADAASADRTTAEFYAQRGDKAVKDKAWSTAQEHYRKALEEDATYLPAEAGLADALFGSGDRAGGVDQLRKFVADAEAAAAPGWPALLTQAKKRLAEYDAADAALDKMVEKRIADLRVFAEKWSEKDPDVAAVALEGVLSLRPDDEAAAELLKKIGKEAPPPPAAAADVTHVFDGSTWTGWSKPIPSGWTIVDGHIVADAPAEVGLAIGAETVWKGDFDVILEARVLEDRSAEHPVLFALHAAMKAERDHSTFGIISDLVFWDEETSAKSVARVYRKPIADLSTPIDVTAWNRYELRFHGDKMECALNGVVLTTVDRPMERGEGGVGMRVQNGKFEFRVVDVVRH